jgi:hypothetical protein
MFLSALELRNIIESSFCRNAANARYRQICR